MIGSLRSACLRVAWVLPLLAAGCAANPPPPPPAATVAAPLGPVSVDGTYQGNRQLVRGGDGPGILCGQIDPLTIKVTGRAFQYVLQQPELQYQPTRTFNVTINDDGTFRAVDGPAYMDGAAGGGTMQGEVSGDACGYVFQADRQQ
jgi:hypothetical protein